MADGRAAAITAVEARMGELDLTQEDLAQKARLDETTVGAFLRGRNWPQVRTRAKLETALGWPVGEIGRIAKGAQPIDHQDELAELRHRLETLSRDLSAALDQLDRLRRRP